VAHTINPVACKDGKNGRITPGGAPTKYEFQNPKHQIPNKLKMLNQKYTNGYKISFVWLSSITPLHTIASLA
jgi:hypothetical protein